MWVLHKFQLVRNESPFLSPLHFFLLVPHSVALFNLSVPSLIDVIMIILWGGGYDHSKTTLRCTTGLMRCIKIEVGNFEVAIGCQCNDRKVQVEHYA